MSCLDVLSDIKCFIVDMDGTFYLGDSLLPGAKEYRAEKKKNSLLVRLRKAA